MRRSHFRSLEQEAIERGFLEEAVYFEESGDGEDHVRSSSERAPHKSLLDVKRLVDDVVEEAAEYGQL